MRLYLDQMFRTELAVLLRSAGHDILRACEIGQSRADDALILERTVQETLDGHFGDWVVLPLSQHPGVIRVKTHPTTTENIAKLLLPFLAKHQQEEFRNRLLILSARRARWIRTAED